TVFSSSFDCLFFFSSRRRHTRSKRDWSSDVCSSDLTRYVFEDVQTGLVPMYFAGQFAGVQTPAILAAIQWASAVYQQDFLQKGRNDLSLDFNQIHADALVAASGLLPSLRMDKNFELTISEKNWTA